MKWVFWVILVILVSASALAEPVIYSGKFRVDTSEGSTINVPIYIKDAAGLYAIKLDAAYDSPGLFSSVGFIPGTFLSENGVAGTLTGQDLSMTQFSPGLVKNILISRKSIATGINGNGLLFTLKFTKKAEGFSDIQLSNIELVDANSNAITNYNVYYIIAWDDTNNQVKYPNDEINFYATLEDKSGNSVQKSCSINVKGSNFPMTYDSGMSAYKYKTSFPASGEYSWTVTCDSTYTASDKVTITQKACADSDSDSYLDSACGGTDCNDKDALVHPNAQELCNGKNDDCDSTTDEDFPNLGQSCSAGVGECVSSGTFVCSADAKSSVCNAVPKQPAAEVCDGKDNDCSGVVDNGVTNSCKNYADCSTYTTCQTCPTAPAEVCDGKDNNCNTQTDEGCSCVNGATKTCGSNIGECKQGTQTCVNGQWAVCTGDVKPAAETCDGKDNDCDTVPDNGVMNSCKNYVDCTTFSTCQACAPKPAEICDGKDNTCDETADEGCSCVNGATRACGSATGECRQGQQTCSSGQWGACIGEVKPAAETCDNKDNDCDGTNDNGVQNTCTNYADCSTIKTCQVCAAMPTEICDGKDNNCNRQTDEGCSCVNGATKACGSNIGECKLGTQTCSNGQWGACTGSTSPLTETCDGKDNDCDEIVDNGLIHTCKDYSTCEFYNTCQACAQIPVEQCDGKDNNCDGTKDEGCSCVDETSKTCGSDIGACSFGMQYCVSGQWGDCLGGIKPSAEKCDGIDNDCDSAVDNGVKNTCTNFTGCAAYLTCDACKSKPFDICDGIDNDCDTVIDLGCSCIDNTSRDCGIDVGECRTGKQSCTDGEWGACTGSINPSFEICDKKDNNCDGVVDEDACKKLKPDSNPGGDSNGGGGSPGGSAGGGGGANDTDNSGTGGYNNAVTCTESWSCDDWGACIGGIQIRACSDSSKCGTDNAKPIIEQACESSDNQNSGNQQSENIDDSAVQGKTSFNLSEANLKKSQISVAYSNSKNVTRKGMFFSVKISDLQGKMIAEEYLGPLAIEPNQIYTKDMNMPLYLLKKGQDYKIDILVSEKGKRIEETSNIITAGAVPSNIFFNRVYLIFGGIILLVLIVIIVFSRLFQGDSK